MLQSHPSKKKNITYNFQNKFRIIQVTFVFVSLDLRLNVLEKLRQKGNVIFLSGVEKNQYKIGKSCLITRVRYL